MKVSVNFIFYLLIFKSKIKVAAYIYLTCASGAGKHHDKDPENVARQIKNVIIIIGIKVHIPADLACVAKV